ncbi:hypothetical protein [Streptomyces clavuligerus]|nr:hypothetical protein [Streptomyces clavuligerus]WDN53935.1 hypothetical protein LL058_19995 [Streptomyces clavuligerus]
MAESTRGITGPTRLTSEEPVRTRRGRISGSAGAAGSTAQVPGTDEGPTRLGISGAGGPTGPVGPTGKVL